MKTFNITIGSLAFALAGAFIICFIADHLFSKDVAMLVSALLVAFPALYARRIVEKIFGYTLLEAMKEKDESGGE